MLLTIVHGVKSCEELRTIDAQNM